MKYSNYARMVKSFMVIVGALIICVNLFSSLNTGYNPVIEDDSAVAMGPLAPNVTPEDTGENVSDVPLTESQEPIDTDSQDTEIVIQEPEAIPAIDDTQQSSDRIISAGQNPNQAIDDTDTPLIENSDPVIDDTGTSPIEDPNLDEHVEFPQANETQESSSIEPIFIAENNYSIVRQVLRQDVIKIKENAVNEETRRNVMVTGYWDPTGIMVDHFSNNTGLNPGGWQGENWEGWGYDIYSYFPEPGTYTGDFEVDYQDTWDDFWRITAEIDPVAIISFGAGTGEWEIENNSRNLDNWVNDGTPPQDPTPSPPDDTVAAGYVRHSTLPVQAIADEVNAQTSINAWIDWDGNPGAFLCEYIAYLGMWYQSTHSLDSDPIQCRASGFVHVDNSLPIDECREAANITIRETIKSIIPQPVAYDIDVTTGWNFISFPLDINGSVDVLFNDSINGDGNTAWDMVQWYDANDPADHWKTYSKDRPPILNDMPDVNNTMGVWINITSNGGDGLLTTGLTGLWPISSVSVPLYTGWNMVGYAAQNDSAYTVWNLKNDTGATSVEGFGAGPYNLQVLDDSYVLKQGEGYWVWIDSPTMWTIDW